MDILMLGAGALGSNIAKTLTPDLKGEHNLTVLDFDTVAERNIQGGTQFYTEDQIGLPKTEALQYNLYKWFSREIHILTQELTSDNISVLASQHLIIDCFDNYKSRKLVQDFSKQFSISCLHVGFSPDMTFAIEWSPNYHTPSDIVNGLDICELPGAAAFVNRVAALGSLVAQAFINDKLAWEMVGNKFTQTEIQ